MRTVSEREFPISATMTGALLVIKPGALRELHWHPNAAEWQFWLKGTGRMTVFGSHGRARKEEFAMGDVGYVPQDSSDGFREAIYARTPEPDVTDPTVIYQGGTFLMAGIPMTSHKNGK